MRRLRIIVLIIMTLLICVACNNNLSTTLESDLDSDMTKEELSDEMNTISIAVGEWSPYISENLVDFGFAAEIARKSFENVDIVVEYEFLPWPRTLAMTENNEYDGTLPWTMSDERLDRFEITDSFLVNEEKFIYLKNNLNMPEDFNTSLDMKNLKISGMNQYTHIGLMNNMGIDFEIVNNDFEAFAQLMIGRIDTFPINVAVAMNILEERYPEKMDDVEFLETPLFSDEMGMLVSKDNPKKNYYIDQFNKGYAELVESGEYKIILEKHNFEFLIGE